jgi:hypothetical protein
MRLVEHSRAPAERLGGPSFGRRIRMRVARVITFTPPHTVTTARPALAI